MLIMFLLSVGAVVYLVLLCDTGCVHSGRCTKYVVKCMVLGFRREH